MSTETKDIQLIQGTTRPLNILMVTPRYLPFIGGVETHVHEVGRRLAHNGVNVTLLTTVSHAEAKSLPEEENVEGMRVIRVPAWPSKHDYCITPAIDTIIRKGSWDVVHCQGCHTLIPLQAILAAKRAHIPYMVTFHTGGNSSRLKTKIRDLQWQVSRPFFVGAAKLIGVSHYEANYFRNAWHLPEQQVTVIPNGATMPGLSADKSQQHVDASLIISIGRLEQYKGHHRLINALPKILEQRPDARLLIIGGGPYEATLRTLAHTLGVAEHVEIRTIPSQERQLMAQTLSQAALVTLMSEYEAHPIAVMEALSLHRPVLVADTSGLHELAEQGLVQAIPLNSTPEEVAMAVLQQMEEPLIPTQFSLPSWEDCVQALQDIYTACARRNVCVS